MVYPRENFNTFWDAFIAVFILINGEDWNSLMNMLVRFYEKNEYGNNWIPILYCTFSIIFGNLTLLALFTGMLLLNKEE